MEIRSAPVWKDRLNKKSFVVKVDLIIHNIPIGKASQLSLTERLFYTLHENTIVFILFHLFNENPFEKRYGAFLKIGSVQCPCQVPVPARY